MKSTFRMITPYLNRLDLPMIAVNHIYMEQSLFPKAIMSGGTGIYLSADTIFIIGRQQEKEGTEVVGYNFVLNIEKSRYAREKSKILINVTHEAGINKWSGLLAMALESGHVVKPSNGWYSKVDMTTGEIDAKKYREADTSTSDFWIPVLKQASFKEWVSNKYKVSSGTMLNSEAIDAAMEEVTE
jgi:hypothetical protein